MFSDKEIAYLNSQRLARIATVSSSAQPDVSPVVFQFDGERFIISGQNVERTQKYKNVNSGSTKVGLVIDDLESISPWTPRGVKVHGTAEISELDGRAVLVIRPDTHWSWGIEDGAFEGGRQAIRKVKHVRG